MSVMFHTKYFSEWENKHKPIELMEGLVVSFEYIKWEVDNVSYEVNNRDSDFTRYTYVSQESILVLYSADPKYSPNHPHPNNLVLYNLKKEVVKIIAPPKARKFFIDLPFEAIWSMRSIKGKQFIPVSIYYGNPEDDGYRETHYLDPDTFEFHPDYYDVLQVFGRSSAPLRSEEYGR